MIDWQDTYRIAKLGEAFRKKYADEGEEDGIAEQPPARFRTAVIDEDDSPWLRVAFTRVEPHDAGLRHEQEYAIWRTTHEIYTVNEHGEVSEDPITFKVEAAPPADWLYGSKPIPTWRPGVLAWKPTSDGREIGVYPQGVIDGPRGLLYRGPLADYHGYDESWEFKSLEAALTVFSGWNGEGEFPLMAAGFERVGVGRYRQKVA